MTVIDPEVGWGPDQEPLPLQAVAFWLLQVRVALWPGMTALGFRERLTLVGGPGWETTTDGMEPLLHPVRTKEETVKNIKKGDVLGKMGMCIWPSCLSQAVKSTLFKLEDPQI